MYPSYAAATGVLASGARKVAVSACLLGEFCRYDAQSKRDEAVMHAFKNDEIIPFCPEAPVLGTPRERICVIQKGDQHRVIGEESGEDFTRAIMAQVDLLVQNHPDLDIIVLKSKSPSCGLGTTPIYDENRKAIGFGNGIAAQRLKEIYPNIVITDELNLKECKC